MGRPPPETIAAVATARGRGGIGVVRLSGSGLAEFARRLIGRTPSPRAATLSTILDRDSALLDRGIVIYYPAPHSFTGEDVLELQAHGGPVLLDMLLERCLELGARLAQPGEFSRRAFLNGKMDLTQAEGVADLIDASSSAAVRAAARSLDGVFAKRVSALVRDLVELRMRVEATLDFPEEEGVSLDLEGASARLESVQQAVEATIAAARQGRLLREGIKVVLAGRPNVGKSSLLNRLAGADRAIVTEVPGTTRDALSETIDLDGVPLHLVDTAGLRLASDRVEAMGVERSWSEIGTADLILRVIDAQEGELGEDREIAARLPPAVARLTVANKVDLTAGEPRVERTDGVTTVYVSALSGGGMALLSAEVLELVGRHPSEGGDFSARRRHITALEEARDRLAEARTLLGGEEALVAEELRRAHLSLQSITGEFSSDDLLGEIFSHFCLGK